MCGSHMHLSEQLHHIRFGLWSYLQIGKFACKTRTAPRPFYINLVSYSITMAYYTHTAYKSHTDVKYERPTYRRHREMTFRRQKSEIGDPT